MGDKIKILEDISTLARMCRSKSDGASLKIEEDEINSKIADLQNEITDLKISSEEDNYDTSAEMADRNIEIISKKIIQNVKNECKVKDAMFYYWFQMGLNFLWSILFFGFQLRLTALIDLMLLLIFVLAMIYKFYKIKPTSAYLNIPYVFWLIYALVLNYYIWFINK